MKLVRPKLAEGWHYAMDDLYNAAWQEVSSSAHPGQTYHVLSASREEMDHWTEGPDNVPAGAYQLRRRAVAVHPIEELPDDEGRTNYQVAFPTIGKFSCMSFGVLHPSIEHFVPFDPSALALDVPHDEIQARFPGAVILGRPFAA